MDYEPSPPMQSQSGMCGADSDIFQRVWRRVMPQETPGCPIILTQPAVPPEPLCPPPVAPQPPAIHAPITVPTPAAWEPPTISENVPTYGALLQGFIADEFEDARTYAALARRVSGSGQSTLLAISREESRHQKRLTASYFLLEGVRLLPQRHPCHPPQSCLPAALRERFWAEKSGAEAYRNAAATCTVPMLKPLYLELAEDEESHAALLRSLLEKG
ncbi:MAG: rubrerythrin [Oscillospiraceae bacterium]